MSHVRFGAAACIAVALAGAILLAQGKPTPKPPRNMVSIEIAGTYPNAVPLMTAGAWPLTIRMVADKILGIGTYKVPNQFPIDYQQGFIVFADPDHCFSLALGATCAGVDETYLEFTPTINLPDLGKQSLETVPVVRLGGRPSVLGWRGGTPGDNTAPAPVGPFVGSGPYDMPCDQTNTYVGCDNYGYGATPNLPGLVILSDRGVGLVWDEVSYVFEPKARNLAGFINSIGWTMNDCNENYGCRTSVTAHMNVPVGLFTPVVRIDFGGAIENSNPPIVRDRWYQIDGGPWTKDNQFLLSGVLNQIVTTVRVFVVSGHAPDVVEDWNGDGKVDAQDLLAHGYTLLSQEVVFQFRTYHQEEEYGIGVAYDYIPDGMVPPVLPAGGGGVNPVPR